MHATTTPARWALPLAALIAFFALAACDKHDDKTGGASHAKQHAGESGAAHGNAAKKDDHRSEGKLKLSADEIQTAGIKVEELQPQSFVDQVVLTATIRANQDRIAHVAPRVSARIVKVSANLGDKVTTGQPLAQLDSIELGDAHSAYRQAQSQYSLATSDFERARKLKAEDIIAEKDYLRTRSEYEKARASLRATDDRLRLLGVDPDRLGQNATGSVFALRAPFSGVVTEKHAILGELAQPDKSIFTIADLSVLWIEANLFEKDLGRVRLRAAAGVTVAAYPGEVFKGRLTYIGSALDKETRALHARVEVPNPDGRLKPEMFATASIDTAATTVALTLPKEAVLLLNGQPTVFVLEGDAFEPRAIELGEPVGRRVTVKSGLKAGDRVVGAGAYALKARIQKSQISDSH